MPNQLVVVQPFGDYARGDLITDADAMREALKSHAPNVHKIAVDEPEPAKSDPAKPDDKPAAPKPPAAPEAPPSAAPKA